VGIAMLIPPNRQKEKYEKKNDPHNNFRFASAFFGFKHSARGGSF
jgi:hypothetical protein